MANFLSFIFSSYRINGTCQFIIGFFLSKEKPESFVPTESIWTENIMNLSLFYFFLWMWAVHSKPHRLCLSHDMHIFCANQMAVHSQASGNLKKSCHFIASQTQTSPTWGIELPSAATLDPGGTGAFGGPIKSWAIWIVWRRWRRCLHLPRLQTSNYVV